MNRVIPRADIEKFTAALAEKRRRLAKAEHSTRGYRDADGAWRGGLLSFVRYFWHILEPGTPFVDGWVLEAICLPFDSKIQTEEGPKPIGEIVESGWQGNVLSFNHTTGTSEWRPILNRFKTPGRNILSIRTSDGMVKLTPNHPVFVVGRGYVKAGKVNIGDTVYVSSMPDHLRCSSERKRVLSEAMLSRSSVGDSQTKPHAGLQALRERILSLSFTPNWWVLFAALLRRPQVSATKLRLRKMWVSQIMGRFWLQELLRTFEANRADACLRSLRQGNLSFASSIRSSFKKIWRILQSEMLWTLVPRGRPYVLCERIFGSQISGGLLECQTSHLEERKNGLFYLRGKSPTRHSSYRSRQTEQRSFEFGGSMSGLSLFPARPLYAKSRSAGCAKVGPAIVVSVKREAWIPDTVYNIEVEGNNNYFANGVLLHNCEHLEAVTFGEITNLLINVPPGFSKSLITNCFWPAWEWGAMELSHIRYVTFSYSSSNTQRDNQRFGDLVASSEFKVMYPEVQIRQNGMEMVSNYKHGWKLASSVTGSATGKRGNRAICDDLNNVKESESKPVMEETNRWFRESLSSRLNDMEKDAKIVIAQRVGEGDVSGEILRLKLPYCHLMIQMEYEWQADEDGQPYTTSIGWVDPRWTPNQEDCEGALAWTERFSENAVQALKVELGPFATAAQLQQTPEARGGGVLKREWWLPGEQYMTDNKFPPFQYVVASLDGAFDEKEENDASALTIWGIFSNELGYPRAMLVHAWARKLQISGIKVEVEPGEHESVYRRRAMPHWGLVEWVADTCNRFKVDRLLIENKASGKPAAQSLQNSHGRQGWAIVLVEPKGDKYARGLAVQPSFSQGMIYAPDREWAEDVIDECAIFPRGRNDDRYDSTTQAIKHLRDTGLLRSDEDRRAEELDAVRHKGAPKAALYPGFKRRQA